MPGKNEDTDKRGDAQHTIEPAANVGTLLVRAEVEVYRRWRGDGHPVRVPHLVKETP